jgi:hypothetical protein
MSQETREQIVARVSREQELLHPTPVYSRRSRARLRVYLIVIAPLSLALGWLAGALFGWNGIESAGFGVGLILAFGYLGLVLLTERDDGRIHDQTQRLIDARGAGGLAREEAD